MQIWGLEIYLRESNVVIQKPECVVVGFFTEVVCYAGRVGLLGSVEEGKYSKRVAGFCGKVVVFQFRHTVSAVRTLLFGADVHQHIEGIYHQVISYYIVLGGVIGCPALNMGAARLVRALGAEAAACVPHKIVFDYKVFNMGRIVRWYCDEEIFYGIVAVLHHVSAVEDVLLRKICSGFAFAVSYIELLGNGRVIYLGKPAVPDGVPVAAAVYFNGVAVSRAVVSPKDPFGLNGAADPVEFAVLNRESAGGTRADSVRANVTDTEIINSDVGTGSYEPVTFD